VMILLKKRLKEMYAKRTELLLNIILCEDNIKMHLNEEVVHLIKC
jgi:hypothetical protein